MTTITLDAIRAASDIPTEAIAVPEWGDAATVTVRGLSKAQTSAIFAACMIDGEKDEDGKITKIIDPKKLEDELFLACVIEPKFQREDLAWLAEKANAPIQRIQLACVRVAGLTKEALADAKSPAKK